MKLHPQFRLNGTSYSSDSLLAAAKQWQNDADVEQKDLGIFLVDWLSDSETVMVHTSGSTGVPKPLLVSKVAMQTAAKRTADFFELLPGDTALLCLPMGYIAGKMMVVRAMVIGLVLDVIPPKTTLQLKGKKYDFAALIPLQAKASFTLLEDLKTVLIGGAPIPVELRKALAKKHPHCVETYGMTETLTHVATRPVHYPAIPFKAMPNVALNVDLDSCLVLTVPHLSETPIVTNDVVELVDERSFQLLGRRDFVINSGGKKICPEQLEEKLSAVLETPFFFTGIPDDILGEQLALVVEGNTKNKMHYLKIATKILSSDKHHVPKAVFCVDAFAYTPSGKLDRAGTKAMAIR